MAGVLVGHLMARLFTLSQIFIEQLGREDWATYMTEVLNRRLIHITKYGLLSTVYGGMSGGE